MHTATSTVCGSQQSNTWKTQGTRTADQGREQSASSSSNACESKQTAFRKACRGGRPAPCPHRLDPAHRQSCGFFFCRFHRPGIPRCSVPGYMKLKRSLKQLCEPSISTEGEACTCIAREPITAQYSTMAPDQHRMSASVLEPVTYQLRTSKAERWHTIRMPACPPLSRDIAHRIHDTFRRHDPGKRKFEQQRTDSRSCQTFRHALLPARNGFRHAASSGIPARTPGSSYRD